jgi:hypothetical protein
MTGTSRDKNTRTKLLIAVLSTITVGFAAGSAIVVPSPLKVLVLVLFVVASTLSWSAYAKRRTEIKKHSEAKPEGP